MTDDTFLGILAYLRRFAYTTPKSFLELIKLYTSMVGMKAGRLSGVHQRGGGSWVSMTDDFMSHSE